MKPINIFAITRITQDSYVRRFEKQMSERNHYLHVKKWEIDGLRKLVDHLCPAESDYEKLEFYYSFQIPKLGKEFDLLQISEDDVVNIELKSEEVPEEKIKKQLLLNRHYLAALGKNIYSYTYISSTDKLYRLTHSERLVEAEWEKLRERLQTENSCYTGDVEDLFLEETYLISPLTDPDRFLRRDYFLTSQQKDIRQKILNSIAKKQSLFQGFTGLPGTGKTLLLYDIAMQMSGRQKVCVLHMGSFPEELKRLDTLLKRIDFYQPEDLFGTKNMDDVLQEYTMICVDEGHRVSREQLEELQHYAERKHCPVVFSYDCEDVISPMERKEDVTLSMEALPSFVKYRLTNRIRTNSELSNFIQCVFLRSGERRRNSYQSVSMVYAQNEAEVELFLKDFQKKGYIYLYSGSVGEKQIAGQGIIQFSKKFDDAQDVDLVETIEVLPAGDFPEQQEPVKEKNNLVCKMEASKATCKEFDRVVMLIDKNFTYDEEGFLRTKEAYGGESPVRTLFHGLSRAKNRLALVVVNNPEVFGEILNVMQGYEK